MRASRRNLTMTATLRRAVLAALIAVVAVAATSAAAPAKTTAAPKQTGEARITGGTTAGKTLTVTNGTWTGNPTSFAYQWYLCDNPGKTNCNPISGATTTKYRLHSSEVGHTLFATVTATNAEGSGTAQTDAVGPVKPNGAPRNTAAPSVAGTTQVGQTLTANVGSWTQ